MNTYAAVLLLLLLLQGTKRLPQVDLTASSLVRTSRGVPGETISSVNRPKRTLPIAVVCQDYSVGVDGDQTITFSIVNKSEANFDLPISEDESSVHRDGLSGRKTLVLFAESMERHGDGSVATPSVIASLFMAREEKQSYVTLPPGYVVDLKLRFDQSSLELREGDRFTIVVQELTLLDSEFTVVDRSALLSSTVGGCKVQHGKS